MFSSRLALLILLCSFIAIGNTTAPPHFFVYATVGIGGGIYEGTWLEQKADQLALSEEEESPGLVAEFKMHPTNRVVLTNYRFEIKRVKTILDKHFEFPIRSKEEAQAILRFAYQSKGTLSLTHDTLVIGSHSWANTQNGNEAQDLKNFIKMTSIAPQTIYSFDSQAGALALVVTHPGDPDLQIQFNGKVTERINSDRLVASFKSLLGLERMGNLRHALSFSYGDQREHLQSLLTKMKRLEAVYLELVGALKRRSGTVKTATARALLLGELMKLRGYPGNPEASKIVLQKILMGQPLEELLEEVERALPARR